MTQNETANGMSWDTDVERSERGVSFLSNTIVRILISTNAVFVLASFAVLGFVIRPTSGLFVLHYNVYFGVEIQGVWWQAFMLPAAGILFLCGHLFLAKHFYGGHERIAAYLMLLGSCLIGIGILIASSSIAFINY